MATYVNSGIGAQIVAQLETTYGVAAALTGSGVGAWEFDSETLELKKTTVQGQGLHAGGLYGRASRRKLTNYQVAGGVNMDLPSRYINSLLMAMTGSKGSAASVLTQIATSGVYQAQHAPGNMKGTSLTIQKGVPPVDGGAPLPITYVGCKVDSWQISVATGAIAKLALTFDGRNELAGPFPNGGASASGDPLNAATPALAAYTDASSNDVFYFREATILTGGTPSTTSGVTTIAGGTAAGNVKDCTIKQQLHYNTSRFFLGSSGFKAEQIENKWRDITGSMTVEWLNSEAMYNAFAADTPTSLQLTFTGPIIGTSGTNTELLQILIPVLYFDGESPKVGGPDVVDQKVTFTGLDDTVNNPIQINYQTVDTA